MRNIVAIFLVGFVLDFGRSALIKDDKDTKLVLVHGIFRHGARTTYGFYPTDPHKNNTFYPIGLGGLTNEGKLQEYELGRYLRKEYGNFLDEIYSEELVEVRSTGVERTIMSAQLVMAGLFPPVRHQIWHSDLPWQPVPIFFRPEDEEDVLHPKKCNYRAATEMNLTNIPEVYKLYVEPYKKLFEYVSNNSGLSIKSVHDLLELYFIVSTEHEMNLILPDWVLKMYPEPLLSAASLTYKQNNFDKRLKMLNMGYLLQKIVNDTKAKMDASKQLYRKKMYLYSGHEITLGYFLDGLNAFEPHVPPYGAIILLEIHVNNDGKYFVKLRYKKGHNNVATDLKMKGCTTLCPWETFLKVHDELMPKISVAEACELDT